MLDQALDLRGLLRALRRRWILVGLGALVGVLGAVAVARLPEPSYAATARVLIPLPPRDPRPGERPVQTQVAIIESSLIAADVAGALPQTRPEQWVRERTRARAVGEQIIAITAVGLTPIDAANLANLVSDRYVSFASGRTDSDAEVRVTTLRRRAADLESRVRALDGEIGGVNAQLAVAEKNSPESASLTGTVEGLRSQRGELAKDLSGIQGRIDEAELERQLTRQSLQILEPADPTRAEDTRRTTLLASIMLLLGLAGGAGLAVAREHRARRVRTRDALAAVTGSPVLAATSGAGKRLADACCELAQFGEINEPAFARELGELLAEPRNGGQRRARVIVVLGTPNDGGAVVAAFKMAAMAADLGRHTLLLEAMRGKHAFGALLGPITKVPNPRVRDGLEIGAAPANASSSHRRAAGRLSGLVTTRVLDYFEAVVVYLPLDGRPDAPVVVDVESETVLAVSAGVVKERTLKALATQTSDWGFPLTGVVVVDPDPADESTGRLERTWIGDAIGADQWRAIGERWRPAIGPAANGADLNIHRNGRHVPVSPVSGGLVPAEGRPFEVET